MAKFLWQKTYAFLVLPLIFLFAHISALFSKKVRSGLFPRRTTIADLEKWLAKQDKSLKNIVLFHAASLGEFEHIKPLLYSLKEKYNTTNILTFFSPSGFKNVKETPGLDYYLYMPFDFGFHWKKLYKLLNPYLLIISKHDVWPMQIWQAKKMKIPVYLVNASLPENSSRTKPLVKRFLKHVYRDFSRIYTIAEEDAQRFYHHYPRCLVEVMGDTKYDQVMLRKKAALKKELIPEKWHENKWTFLAGSIWPEDETNLMPGLINLLNKYNNVNLIIVPHEPTEKFVTEIEEKLAHWAVIRFTNIKSLAAERVIIVNTIGHLADLYQYAKAAYVGGSFKQGIHNVMEPAIYGIPVIYGPIHENIYEAIKMTKSGSGIVVENEVKAMKALEKIYNDESFRKSIGHKAMALAQENMGATEKILNKWKYIFINR